MEQLEVMLTEQQLSDRVAELGAQITKDYAGCGSKLLFVSILKGSVVFLSDLMRKTDLPLAIDFMVASSYGCATESNGSVKIIKDLGVDISDYDVLIVEDILDSGYTLSKIIEILKTRNPRSLKVCALLDKPERRVAKVNLDYTGFVIKDKFIVGYGLDYNEQYRNLPYIGIINE